MARFVLLLAVLATAFVAAQAREAEAGLPSSGSDLLPLVAVIEAQTPLGEEHIALSGWGRLDRAEPRIEGGVQVVDMELMELQLRGAAALGIVIVSEQAGQDSLGGIASVQPGEPFPATSYIDLFVDIAMPDSAFGPLGFSNAEALPIVPREDGAPVPLQAWPPLGVTYGFASDIAGEAPCLSLIKDDANPDGIELCVTDVALEIAPQWPSYSVARGGPSELHPADLFVLTPTGVSTRPQAPFLGLSCLGLGLTAEGCDDGSDGSQDDLNALSFGGDLPGGEADVEFSVEHGALGAPGSGVAGQAACPPANPGFTPEPGSDLFRSMLDGTNALLLDGNGPIGACTSAFPLGLVEGFGVRDDLDAVHALDTSHVDDDGDGVPDRAVYFSLDAASPSLVAIGASAADVLRTASGEQPSVFATAAQLGLGAGDDIDALCLRESGDAVFGPGDVAYYSLAPGSPTLAASDAGPGDLLAPGTPPKVRLSSVTLGLVATDNVNALTCASVSGAGDGDADCDGETTSVDAALVLQLDAGLLGSLPCETDADVNRDGIANSADAALILQVVAGLLDLLSLP